MACARLGRAYSRQVRARAAPCYADFMTPHRFWLAAGITGFAAGLGVFLEATDSALSHLGLLLAIAAPVIAFYRLMKPFIGARHCPVEPDWTAR